ncbi:MAG: hypothetical protein KF789_06780 [Bdellovibrionaceae bacterium]|nr:hypothetical protein [Pseudobdellovibrionaceae bacterium]
MRAFRPFAVLLILWLTSTAGASPSLCSDIFVDRPTTSSSGTHQGLALLPYYLQKAKELNQLDHSAPFAVSLRLLIMTTTHEVRTERIALKDLHEIHPISRPASMEKLTQRMEGLEGMPRWTWRNQEITNDVLNAYLPSKNSIRVVQRSTGDYVVFDGNGRLFALKQVFPDSVKIEVEHYVSSSSLLQRNLEKLLETRGLR